MDLNEHIEGLAADVERRWAVEGGAREAFPEVATAALEAAAFAAEQSVASWLAYVLSRQTLPRQVDPFNAFGEPPVTLAFRERFAIDLYFWHRPTVDLHNHSFDGAFAVVEGTSLHSHFSFAPESGQGGPVRQGRVQRERVELLPRGSVRPIRAGTGFIHQVLHLSRPCLSLVLRTHPDASDPPIYTYLPPRLALLQRRYLTEAEHKQLALVPLVLRLEGLDARGDLLAMLDRAGDLLVAWALRVAGETTQDMSAVRGLAGRLAPRPWIAGFLDSMESTDTLEIHWDMVPQESHRFVLALARAAGDRATRERVAGEYQPGFSYADLVLTTLRELSAAGMFGVPLPDLAMGAVRAILDGMTDEQAAEAMLPGQSIPALHARAVLEQMRTYLTQVPLLRRLVQFDEPA
jgi:hypothetical protein